MSKAKRIKEQIACIEGMRNGLEELLNQLKEQLGEEQREELAYTGKVICLYNGDFDDLYTAGKAYKVENDIFPFDDGDRGTGGVPTCGSGGTFDLWERSFSVSAQFAEVKGQMAAGWNAKVFCVSAALGWTKGFIYIVANGLIENDSGKVYKVQDLQVLKTVTGCGWIEVVE